MEEKKKKGFIAQFKEFVMRGNVLDMAVGVIIATAFSRITTSLVNDVFMPLLGWLIGDIDLTQLNIVLSDAVVENGEVVTEAVIIGIGTFIAAIIDFILIALVIFIVMKVINSGYAKLEERKKAEEEVAAAEESAAPTTEQLLGEILAELKKDKCT